MTECSLFLGCGVAVQWDEIFTMSVFPGQSDGGRLDRGGVGVSVC